MITFYISNFEGEDYFIDFTDYFNSVDIDWPLQNLKNDLSFSDLLTDDFYSDDLEEEDFEIVTEKISIGLSKKEAFFFFLRRFFFFDFLNKDRKQFFYKLNDLQEDLLEKVDFINNLSEDEDYSLDLKLPENEDFFDLGFLRNYKLRYSLDFFLEDNFDLHKFSNIKEQRALLL